MKINKTRTFDQGPITPLQIQNKNKRAPTIYTCKRSPVRGQESRLVRARLQFEIQRRSFPQWSYRSHMYMNRDVCKQGKPPAEVIFRAQNDLFREPRCYE
jgi:hypothetical protein